MTTAAKHTTTPTSCRSCKMLRTKGGWVSVTRRGEYDPYYLQCGNCGALVRVTANLHSEHRLAELSYEISHYEAEKAHATG